MNKILVVVQSPFQLINVHSYLAVHNLENENIDYIFLTIKSQTNSEQLHSTFKILNLKGSIYEIKVFGSNRLNIYKRSLLLYKLRQAVKKFQQNKYSLTIVGHIRSNYQLILANSSTTKCIYVDDGSATYRDVELLENNKKTHFLSSIKVKGYSFFGLNTAISYYKNKLFLYTIYGDVIKYNHPFLVFELNELATLKKKLKDKIINENTIYFIGTNLIPEVTSLEVFKKLILKISLYYREQNKRVLYFPHREDSEYTLESIKNLGWQIHKAALPIELTLLSLKDKPVEYSMYFTSAMNSIVKLTPDAKFRSFFIRETDLKPKRKQSIVNLYKTYESNNNIELEYLDY